MYRHTVILHLTIGQPVTSEFTASGCANYTLPWGTVVTTSGDYSNVYQTSLGCDSTVTAHITIGTGGHTDTTVVACRSFTWNRTTKWDNFNRRVRYSDLIYNWRVSELRGV